MSVLQDIVEKKHYSFIEDDVTWQEAVRLSLVPLVADGTCEEHYFQEIVACIEKHGPYVVFDGNVAMPHSTEGATGVNRTGIGFMVSKKMIDFGVDEDGEKKEADLFFTLASLGGEEHMNNIMQLSEIFQNEPLLAALRQCKTPEDILKAEAENPYEDDF